MLIFMLLACSGEANNPPVARTEITVQTLRWSWGYALEPVGSVDVMIDDRDGHRILDTTANAGEVTFEVDPDDGPFTVSALAYDEWPHAISRMGVTAMTDETVTLTFSAKEYQLPTVTVYGTAFPRHDDSNLLVTLHQPDLVSTSDSTGPSWSVEALPEQPYRMLATEYVQRNHGDRGEYTRDFYRWFRYVHGAPHEDLGMKILLENPILPHRAGGQVTVSDELAGPFATLHANVLSESSAWHNACGYATLAARTPDKDGWFWAMEWASPTILGEDMVTQLWVTAPDVSTMAVRPYAPDDMGDIDLLPAPRIRAHERDGRTMYVFDDVPADARPMLYIVDRDAPSRVLWAVEGDFGADRMVRPELPGAALLPDVTLATVPALLRRGTDDPWFDYDMAWGPMAEVMPGEPMTPGEIPGVAQR